MGLARPERYEYVAGATTIALGVRACLCADVQYLYISTLHHDKTQVCHVCAARSYHWYVTQLCSVYMLGLACSSHHTNLRAGPASVIHPALTYVEGLCVDAGKGALRSTLSLQQCSPTAAKQQNFKWSGRKQNQLVHVASGLCI